MASSTSDPASGSHPSPALPASPLAPVNSRNRRSSMASESSPLRHRRSSLSTNQPPSPNMPLAAAASVNAGMRAGSPGPASTARDSVVSRQKSVVADLALADDSLPPPAEIAVSDRKSSIAEGMKAGLTKVQSLGIKDSGFNSSSVSPSPFTSGGSRGSLSGAPSPGGMTGIEPARSGGMNTADPFHKRKPSVGEVHQQMEQEQEAQVNRLLLQIHQQQMEIEALKRGMSTPTLPPGPPTADSDIPSQLSTAPNPFATPTSNPIHPPPTPERAHSSGSATTTTASTMPAAKVSPNLVPLSRPSRSGSPMSFSLHRRNSSKGSHPESPSIKSTSRTDYLEQDETKYWQTEAGNLERENNLLKNRVKELERQLRSQNRPDDAAEHANSTAPHRSSSLATESMSIDN